MKIIVLFLAFFIRSEASAQQDSFLYKKETTMLAKDVGNRIKKNEILGTKVELVSENDKNKFKEIANTFQIKTVEDLNIKSIKFITIRKKEELSFHLLTPIELSISQLIYQYDINFRYIIFVIDGITFILSPHLAKELDLIYKIIDRDLNLKINNKNIKQKIKRKDWRKVMIEFNYYKEENIYKYTKYNMPFSS
jgi:hypothetical protein